MKIKSPSTPVRKLYSLRDLVSGETYRDVNTGNIWLCAVSGYVNLTKDHIITRYDNMPGPDDNKGWDLRYQKVECVLEVKEV